MWFILLEGDLRPRQLQDDVADPLFFRLPNDGFGRFDAGCCQPGCKWRLASEGFGDLRTCGTGLLNRSGSGAFDQAREVFLIEGKGIIAGMRWFLSSTAANQRSNTLVVHPSEKRLNEASFFRQVSANAGPVNPFCLQCRCHGELAEDPIPQEVPAKRPYCHPERPMGRN